MIIRRIEYFSIIISLLILATSCEDYLTNLPPEGLVQEEYWQSKEDVKASLMGAYKEFANMDNKLFYYGELRGDMIEEGSNLSWNLRQIMNGNLYPNNWFCRWDGFYSVINYCNTVVKYAPKVKAIDPTFTEYMYNSYYGESIFLRSLAYFYLVRIYKDVPLVLKPSDTDRRDFFPEKEKAQVILDTITNQLQRVRKYLPESYETVKQTRARATKSAVDALLANIALWRFNYRKCVTYVERIENSDNYELLPGGEWFKLFIDGNTLEGIFEFQFDSKLDQNNSLWGITRWENVDASSYALELLSPETSDELVRGPGSLRAEDALIWKYVGNAPDGTSMRSKNEQQSANWIVYRLADLKLMKAEALSQLGKFDSALQLVNDIRKRAFLEPISGYQQSETAYEDLILEERARELAFEGKRWFDLLRMGRRNNYARKQKLIEIIIKGVPATQKRVLASKLTQPNGWYFPIHQNEIEQNVNLVQNPYYQGFDTED